MSVGAIILVILFLILLGVIPAYPYSRTWGYGPTGGIGFLLVVIVVLLLLGVI